MIKARVCGGDIARGEAFLDELQPFVWRRNLDFAAIADIQSIKRQIHDLQPDARLAAAGADLKLGPGGIREIEFFAQTQQLILGGRYPPCARGARWTRWRRWRRRATSRASPPASFRPPTVCCGRSSTVRR